MKLVPVRDKIIVEKEEVVKKTTGGILIPDGAAEKPIIGLVLAVGPGRVTENGTLIPLPVEVGDRIIYTKYAGTEIEMDDKKYLILSESDVQSVIKEEN